jgi:hypothetical protein
MTDAHDAKAREIAKSFYLGATPLEISEAIYTALRDCEREALERAEEVARFYAQERTEGWPGLDQDEVCQSISMDIALRIRSLCTQDTTGGE